MAQFARWLCLAILHAAASIAADRAGDTPVRPASPPPPLIFLHIQKAGGHTVDAFFASPLSPITDPAAEICKITSKVQALLEKLVYPERYVAEAALPAFLTKDAVSSLPHMDALFSALKQCRCRIISAEVDGEFVATLQKKWVELCGGPAPLAATILREPAFRAVSAVNHQFSQTKKMHKKPSRIGPALLYPISQGGVLSPDCVHNATFCAGLSDKRRCRFRGSCGYFQDFQAATLAGFFASPMSRLIELDTSNDALLSAATQQLASMDVVGITDAMDASLCMLAHKLQWTKFFQTCCRESPKGSAEGHQRLDCQSVFGKRYNAREQAHATDQTLLDAAEHVNQVDRALYNQALRHFADGLASLAMLTSARFNLLESVSTSISRLSNLPQHQSPPSTRTEAERERIFPQFSPKPLPHWLSPHERRRLGVDATVNHGLSALKKHKKGLALIAMGTNVSFREAYRAASSARQLYGDKLHITLLTDATGLEATRQFSEGIDFDRAVSISGNLQWWAEHSENQIKPSGRVYQAGHLMFAMRQLKQRAFATAAALYDLAVVTDADTFHCDGRALTAMFGYLESGVDLVAVSPARNPNADIVSAGDLCESVMNALSPMQGAPRTVREVEINTGVIGLRGESKVLHQLLARWSALYNVLSLLPCGKSKQDQKAFRVAVEEAETLFGLRVKRLFRDAGNAGTPVSLQPFNCRARPRDDNNARQPEESHCADPRFVSCSILHGHRLAARNTRLGNSNHHGTASDMPDSSDPGKQAGVHVFMHVAKTAGNSFKQTLLKWLLPKKDTRMMHISTAHAALNLGKRWSPSPLVVGAFASSACDWIMGGAATARPVVGDGSTGHCGMFTMLRDPIDRMISELNYCEEIGWYKDQTCSGESGVDSLRALVHSALAGGSGLQRTGCGGAAILAFAKVRGNVQLEHVAGPLSKSDFAVESGTPPDWHDRPVGNRTTPIERRRRRLGPVNTADLMAAEFMLKHRYLAVGLTERFNESMVQMAAILAPDRPFSLDAVLRMHTSGGHTHNHRSFNAQTQLQRSDLSDNQLAELESVLQLDILLYKTAVRIFEDQTKRLHDRGAI